MRTLLALLIFSCSLPALADNYAIGTTFDGYTKSSDGYWYRGSSAYTLKQDKVFTGYNCYRHRNRFYPVPVVYKDRVVEKVVEKPVYQPPKIEFKEGWREIALKAAIEIDKRDQLQKEKEQEHKEYLETIKALGIGKSANYQSGVGYKYSTYSNIYNPNAQQGNTVYGYNSLHSLSGVYGENQIGVWMQQAFRAQSAAQDSTQKSLDGILGVIELDSSRRSDVALTLAKAEVLRALNTEEVRSGSTLEVQGALPPGSLTPRADQVVAANLHGVFANHCAKCHSQQGTIQGKSDLFPQGVDLGQYDKFSYEQKEAVLESVRSGRMPQDGEPLSAEEEWLIYNDVLAAKNAAKK